MDGIIARISDDIAIKSSKLLQITRHALSGLLLPKRLLAGLPLLRRYLSQRQLQYLPLPARGHNGSLAVVSSAVVITLFALPPLFAQTFVQPADPEARTIQQKLLRATPVPLNKVRLTGGPLLKAQELTKQYLLTLEPDRMLALYRKNAGLPPKAEPYNGWDGPGRNLTGHIAGHY
ncbi:MAG TPA: hypothetical protein DCW97_06225, partial [Acidobacteria bacterium]|nr:hypothetical protein [Acidobacteriota bacterium]